MLNNELILEVLRQIEESSQKVIDRFQVIAEPRDFTDSPAGMEKCKGDAGYYYTPLRRH
jgi:hypothetical protein